MTEEPAPPPARGPKNRRPGQARRIWRGLLLLLLGCAIFYQPLLAGLIRLVAVKVALKQNVDLSLKVEGTIFTNLSLRELRATPSGKGPTPVEKISIDEITVQFSIPSLIRKGVSEFLRSYTLRNAYVIVKPVEGTHEQKSDLASTLHSLIQQPALFSDRVDIENLNLIAHVPDGEFAVKGLSLLLDPAREGLLSIERLQVPRVRTWENLRAASSYANRDLILRGLQIDPEIVIAKLEIDASQRAQGINRMDVEGKVFGGDAQFSLLVRELPGKHKNNVSNAVAQIDSQLTNLSLEKVSRYFGSAAPAVGDVSSATIHISGDPNTPSSWTGSLTGDVGTVKVAGATLDKATMRLDTRSGWGTFGTTLFSGSNSVTARADGRLPDSLDAFGSSSITGWFNITANDLRHFAEQIASGRVSGDGTFELRNNAIRVDAGLKAAALAAGSLDLSSAEVGAHITKALPPPDATGTDGIAPFDGLRTRVDVRAGGIRAADYSVDAIEARVSIDEARVRLEAFNVRRAQASVTATGTYTMPRDMKSWTTQPGALDFAVDAPSVAVFNAEPNLNGPDGAATASGHLLNTASGYTGQITANLSALRMRDFAADGLKLGVTVANNKATIDTLVFALNPADGFSVTGSIGLQPPFPYAGGVEAHVRDLARFNGLAPALKGSLAGALDFTWRGGVELQTLRSNGELSLGLRNGQVQDVRAINAGIRGSYSPDGIDIPSFRIASSKGNFSVAITARDDRLRLDNIAVAQGGRTVLTGSLAIPLDLRTPARPETLIPAGGALIADLRTSQFAIDTFFPKGQAPASGIVSATIISRGTIDKPDARVSVTGRGLKARAADKLEPSSLDADLTLLGDRLSLKSRIVQPAISPIDIAGTLPLPLKQIVRDRKIDMGSPLQLSVRMPRSSLAVVPRLSGAVRYIQGTVETKVDIAGTLGKPQISGYAGLDIAAARLANPDMPSLSNFRAQMRFAGNRLTLGPFGGDMSGGHFDVTGGAQFANVANPEIDLRATARNILVLRNEDVTVRANASIGVKGPLAAANVSGDVGVTKSRFFKQIEILPLELPGRPAPKPPAMPAAAPSIDAPPVRDWKFAIKVHTDDPFVIQGNLANGDALVDLTLGGSGRAPTLEGTVTIENFVASLPFSKLRVTNGYVSFTRDNPFVPQLNIQAMSNLQDYNINVLIYGSASDPKTVLSSEPPLRQEDIVALLATGATASSLSSGNALAGRAAVLLAQSLYHKIFKAKPQPADNESFTSRFKVDVGAVDARTGQQSVSSQFKLTPNLYLVGDLDVGGDIRGTIRYLLRFK